MRKPFPTTVLPKLLQEFVGEVAESLGCDDSFVSLPALSALASAIGNTRQIQLRGGWTEPPVVWTGLVADPGEGKTPAVKAATRPLYDLQQITEPGQVPIESEGEKEAVEADNKPAEVQLVTSDATIAGLVQVLGANPRGLLLMRDELAGWVENVDRRLGGDHWLSIHSAGPISIDRANGGSRFVRRGAVSITGGFQPAVLGRALLAQKHRESGLAARFLLSYPPKRRQVWSDRAIRPELEARYEGIFLRLLELEPIVSAQDAFEPQTVRMLADAKSRFVEFFDATADEQVTLEGDLAAMWPKLRAYAARLALVIQYARWAESEEPDPPEVVDEQSMAAGIALASWFAEEARQIYGALSGNSDDAKVRRVIEIVRGHGGAITANELRRADRSIADGTQAELLLGSLARRGLGSWSNVAPTAYGGRPTTKFVLGVYDTPPVPEL